MAGTRWSAAGRTPREGLNCLRLALWCLEQEHGRPIQSPRDAFIEACADAPVPERFVAPGWEQVPLDQVRRLDLIQIGQTVAHHCAIVGEDGWCLETDSVRGEAHLVPLRTVLRRARDAWRFTP